MLELRKEIIQGLRQATDLNIYTPYQEIAGLLFPLITLEMEVADDVRNLSKEIFSYSVKFDIHLYMDDVEELLTNDSIKEYFHSLGIRCTYESSVSKSHHWYKQYRFECEITIKDEDYIII